MRRNWLCSKVCRSSVLLLAATSFIAPAQVLASAQSKQAPMQVPGYTKLLDGSGPTSTETSPAADSAEPAAPAGTTTEAAQPNAAPTEAANQAVPDNSASTAAPPKVDLSPVSLSDADKPADSSAASGSADPSVLKATVEANTLSPKAPNSDGAMDPVSITESKGKKGKGTIGDQARAVTAVPLALVESPDEHAKNADAERENEKVQIAELWDAALTRSPEIQFVIQKLTPTSNHAKAASTMMTALNSFLYAGISGANMMMPGMATYMTTSATGNVMGTIMGTAQSRIAQNAKLNETESVQLFTIIRGIADKLVDTYRVYKEHNDDLEQAQSDFEEMKNMAVDMQKGQTADVQLGTIFTLKKQQREINSAIAHVKRVRGALIDICGPEAVAKLDNELAAERGQNIQVPADTLAGATGATNAKTGQPGSAANKTASTDSPQM